jgi:hypothetical protein
MRAPTQPFVILALLLSGTLRRAVTLLRRGEVGREAGDSTIPITSFAAQREICKEDTMKKHLLACTAVALALGLSPALAADQQGQLPTTPSVSPDTAKSAHQPQSGSADTSGGAAEQSSAPPNSGAASDGAVSQPMNSGQGQADQSSAAKEQSSAPSGSAAATNQPSPSLGQQNNSQPKTQTE